MGRISTYKLSDEENNFQRSENLACNFNSSVKCLIKIAAKGNVKSRINK